MMRLIRIFVLLLVPCYAYAQTSSAKDYEVVRQDERIFLYERWADFPGTTTKSRGLKVIFTVSATFEKMLAMVTEEAKLKEWQKKSRRIQTVSKKRYGMARVQLV
jgi:hypothetical protein